MFSSVVLASILLLTLVGFYMGRWRAVSASRQHGAKLHSLPGYYGWYVAIWCLIPSLFVILVWFVASESIYEWLIVDTLPENIRALDAEQFSLILTDIRNQAAGGVAFGTPDPAVEAAAVRLSELRESGGLLAFASSIVVAAAGLAWAYRRVRPVLRARSSVERVFLIVLSISSTIAILTTIGIVLSLLFEAIRFFEKVPWYQFLFGLEWSPQTAIRADQVGSSGSFGAIPIFAGTLMITTIAMLVAVPVGLMSAIYMSEYATPKARASVKPILEILAGIPTVVFGFFAALTVAPAIRGFGESIGLGVSSESALAAGLVMGIMIIPFVSSLSDDVINAVPQSLRDGSYAMGATKSETIKQVILPAALPGIVGAVLLAISRAIGETMIVVMAAGLAANLTANPLEAVTTVTVQIVTLLVGDQEFDSAKTLAAFALGLALFLITLMLNVLALRIVRKYREKYD